MKFIIEQSAYSGVLKIAGKVAHDMELVTGTLPEIRVVETIDHEEVRSSAARELTIIVATMEHSRWLDAQKNIPTDVLKGKRECYGWFFRMKPCGRDCLSLSEAISGEQYTDCFICRRFLGYPRL